VYAVSGCDFFDVAQARFVEQGGGRWLLLPAPGETSFHWPVPDRSTFAATLTQAEVIAEGDGFRVSFAGASAPQLWNPGGVCLNCTTFATTACDHPYLGDVCPGPDPGDVCELPAETGDCDAAITRYYYDSAAGACQQFTYGGCGGNANNFPTLGECEAACGSAQPFPGETACEVDGTIYPSGTNGIDDPRSCNTCLCSQGQLACTDIACDEPCPSGTEYAVSCSQCGPADGCEILRSGCLPTCETNEDCTGDAPPFCFDGICRNICG
jgi:hypothetical protein